VSGAAVTIGNFDGLHAGHRRIMERVVQLAREHGLTPTVLTFDPHPTRVVAPARAPKLMTTCAQRTGLMRQAGIQNVVVMPFTEQLSKLSPEEFARLILRDQLNARIVLVGANFRFGAGQKGDVDVLRDLGSKLGFTTTIIDEVKRHGRVVSSSGIRKLITEGNVSLANRLLERPYSVEGEIVPGRGVGSKQTVPTLNLRTATELLPPPGVYISRTTDLDGAARVWDSITNIGYRPTFGTSEELTIETFLISPFSGATPSRIRLEFLRRIREEKKFDTPEALRQQILRDVNRAQAYFRRLRRWLRR
jgi:riboflavin kinase/FMN adenylyltransferase